MSGRQRVHYAPRSDEFPDDFPQRLDRLRDRSGLSWRAMARALGVNVRALYRWRSGVWPDAAHFLALLEFAAQQGLLYCVLESAERPGECGCQRCDRSLPASCRVTDGESGEVAEAGRQWPMAS
ncbi:MAG: helix-turn-helix transcriptional regulator [Chloroflexi bacterium]|nr:helix-turn-helix transcriptional regulator [Chloroflexota bacterium]MYJ93153.1 helix-turn-helix transcriptional regulator [Chloroflexota bacterium]